MSAADTASASTDTTAADTASASARIPRERQLPSEALPPLKRDVRRRALFSKELAHIFVQFDEEEYLRAVVPVVAKSLHVAGSRALRRALRWRLEAAATRAARKNAQVKSTMGMDLQIAARHVADDLQLDQQVLEDALKSATTAAIRASMKREADFSEFKLRDDQASLAFALMVDDDLARDLPASEEALLEETARDLGVGDLGAFHAAVSYEREQFHDVIHHKREEFDSASESSDDDESSGDDSE